MKDTSKTAESLDRSKVRLAGSAASLLGLLGTAAAIIGLITYLTSAGARSEIVAYLLLLLAFAGMGLVGGVQLLRGRQSAQQFLLVYWLGVAVAAAVLTLSAILWKVPEGLAKGLSESASPEALAGWAALLGVVVLVLGGAVVALLAMATRPATRQRYASVVLVSIGAAVALVVAVNLVGQYEDPEKNRKNYVHVSMETLGRYGLSGRTKKLLGDIKTPIRMTCVYTSTDKDKRAGEYRPRVLELLEDMKIYGEDVEVSSVASDAGKAELLNRLRGQLGSSADQHNKFLQGFRKDAEAFLGKLDAEQEKWQRHPADSYLNMWSLPMEIAHVVKTSREKLNRAQEKVKEGLAGPGLPDYAELAKEIKDAVKDAKETLDKGAELINGIGKIAKAAADPNARQAVTEALASCSAAAAEMAAGVGKPEAPPPADPNAVLNKYVASSQKAAELAVTAAKQLGGLAGDEQAGLLRENRHFMVVSGAVGVPLNDYYRLLAQLITRDAGEAQAVVKNAKPDYQKKFIVQSRIKVQRTAQSIAQAQKAADALLKRLTTVDKLSQADMDLAAKDKLFGDVMAKLKGTLDAVEKLPKLEDTSLSRDITGDNIVIVEAGGKAEVVDFDEVWPLKVRQFGMPGGGDEPPKRVFHGDTAIGSKVLAMTQEPFATVLLTYWDPSAKMPPQMRQMTPPADIPLRALGTVRKRLEEANFKVENWNLTEEMPDPNDAKDRPKLLIVLPPPPSTTPPPFGRPPPPTPKFTDEHRQKVIDAIGDGLPAIFLATFSPPRRMNMFMPPTQTPYAYGGYLRDEWGIEVMTGYLVVPAVTDDRMPGRYKVDGQRFSYLPLSAFSDHPIGKPLQAQRVLWTNLCPITRKKNARGDPAPPPEGVEIEPLLSLPAHWKATWATRRIEELLQQFQSEEGSYIWPNYAAGDLPVPFDVAVAATRTDTKARPGAETRPRDANAAGDPKKVAAARIVVIGAGHSLMDGYLDREVAVRDTKGTISLTDPPRANADLLINSAYWLIGRQNLIAAGPALATMKEIPPGMKVLMIVIYCGVLPALVVGAGSLVMLRRRR